MANSPQDGDSSGVVVALSLELISDVQANDETAGLETKALADRTALKGGMQARNDARDGRIMANGQVNAAKNRTKRELRAAGKKIAAHLETERQKGEDHPLFRRIHARKSVAAYLPDDAEERRTALEEYEREVNRAETPAEVKKLAAPVLKAFGKERTALAGLAKADDLLKKALEKEDTLKAKVVGSIRGLVAAVQGKYADDPARAREVLGWSDPSRRKTVKAEVAARKASEAARKAEVAAKKAADAARKAEEAAQKAKAAKKPPADGSDGTDG